jgi:hypothetical protein
MNTTNLRNTLATALLLGLFGHSNLASAVALNANLGAAAGATDFYKVTCSSNANGATQGLKVTVVDLAPVAAPLLSVQVVKGILAKNSTDAVDGDTAASPLINLLGGNGVYDVRVNKTDAGAENYKLNYFCSSSAGKLTGMALAVIQNK